MTSIEDRLAADVAGVTGGVVVTEQDLAEARRAVQERLREPGVRVPSWPAVAAAAAALVLVGTGVTAFQLLGDDDGAGLAAPPSAPAGPDDDYLVGSPPTAQLLEGVWRLDNGESVVAFDAAGGVRFDERGTLFSDPVTTGTYSVAGRVITVTITEDEEQDCVGASFSVRASVPSAGNLRFVAATFSDSCPPLSVGRGVLEQALPASPEMAAFDVSSEPGWLPLTDRALLNGVWMAEGGGHLLEMAPSGAYVVADGTGSLVDRGQWALRGSELAFTSSASSSRCAAGDRLVRGPVEQVDHGTTAIRGPVTRDDCGAVWSSSVWLLMPHVGSGTN